MGKKIFSGVQPTGNLHLGNYLGAIKNFVDLNNDNDNKCIFCVVDLHAITVKQNPQELKDSIRETTAAFLASGTMAVAYIQYHWKFQFSEAFFPALNGGEPALLYCLIFFYLACKP